MYYNSCYWMWTLLTNEQIISHKLLKRLKLIKRLLWLQLFWGSSRMKGVSLHCLSQITNWETRSKPIYIWWCIHMHKLFILWKVFHFLSWSKYGCQRKFKGQQDKSQFFWNKYINFFNSLSCIVKFCDFLCLTFKFQHELSISNTFHSYMICVDKLYAHSNFALSHRYVTNYVLCLCRPISSCKG
jgi:hypothetical protein